MNEGPSFPVWEGGLFRLWFPANGLKINVHERTGLQWSATANGVFEMPAGGVKFRMIGR
jgi:hypothetical protein